MQYHLYFFSSTGNTARAVEIISMELRNGGHDVEAVRINRVARPIPGLPDRLLIAFPTFAWIPPVLVQRFLRRLPRGVRDNGVKVRAAVFTADGGGCLQAPEQVVRMLRRRGYDVFLSGRASFPENWQQVIPGPDEETKKKQIETGENMTREYARNLLEEKERHYRTTRFHRLWSRFAGSLFAFFGRRFMGKMFIADSDCTSCGLCRKSCPVGAIELAPGKGTRPFWKVNCESCNRCINICPEKAIVCSYARILVLMTAITIASVLVLGAHTAWLKPQLHDLLPHRIFPLLNSLLATALVTGACFFVIGPFDRYFLRRLQCVQGLAKLFSFGFNKKFRRYLMPGFKPPPEHSLIRAASQRRRLS